MRAPWLLIVALAGSTGCYRYVPVEPGAVTPGTEVAVDLTSTGTANVRPAVGDFAERLEGRITESSADGLTLQLTSVQRRGEPKPSTWTGETIRLGTADIDGLNLRQFARGRTTVAAVALGAASVGLVIAIAKAVGILEVSGSTGKPIPPP